MKGFLITVTSAAVLVWGGWAIGWLNFSSSDEQSIIEVDKEQVEEDTEKAKEATQQAAEKVVDETKEAAETISEGTKDLADEFEDETDDATDEADPAVEPPRE